MSGEGTKGSIAGLTRLLKKIIILVKNAVIDFKSFVFIIIVPHNPNLHRQVISLLCSSNRITYLFILSILLSDVKGKFYRERGWQSICAGF